jgi:hypothetical protein
VVLSAPESPMLAGAVALAAGRFQPLVPYDPLVERAWDLTVRERSRGFGHVLTLGQAWDFARGVEDRVAAVVAHYGQLGDDCDFVTLAGDWPYRYDGAGRTGPGGGVYALDDLIGRKLKIGPNRSGTGQSQQRWAFTGRLLGDPAASVARAMGALFLQPKSAILWNTHGRSKPWSFYTLEPASELLARRLPGPAAIVHRAGRRATLTAWHGTVDPVNPFGLVLFNSSGGPDNFTILGGPGRPEDVPWGVPAVVSTIHSFSAVDPTNPETIAGRWLAHGAFIYFGSVHEPFLPAFRTPRLVAELLAAGVPLVAALRQGESEAFGFPWRLVYLGDPLYRIQAVGASPGRAAADVESRGSESSPTSTSLANRVAAWSTSQTSVPSREGERVTPSQWQAMAADRAHWPAVEIAPGVTSPVPAPDREKSDTEDQRLRWCLESAIAELTSATPGSRTAGLRDGARVDWRTVLRSLRRDRLHQQLRAVFDDLLIDALREAGTLGELQSRLAQIPPDECGERVWLALETCATARLARVGMESDPDHGFAEALDLWDEVLRLSWPAASAFPARFTQRVAALAEADPSRRLPAWLLRLRRLGPMLGSQARRFPGAAIVAAERARVEARLARH